MTVYINQQPCHRTHVASRRAVYCRSQPVLQHMCLCNVRVCVCVCVCVCVQHRLGATIHSAAGGNVGAMTGLLIVMYTVTKIVAQLLQSANDVVFRFRE